MEHYLKKCEYCNFCTKKIKTTSTATATSTAYHALFERHFRHDIVLWGGSLSNNLQKSPCPTEVCLKKMEELKPLDSCKQANKTLNNLTIIAVYILETTPYTSGQTLNTIGDFHSCKKRIAQHFTLPVHRTVLFAKKPSSGGVRLFKSLPPEVKRVSEETTTKHAACKPDPHNKN